MAGANEGGLAKAIGWSATSAGVAYFAGSAPLLARRVKEMVQYTTLAEEPLQLQILLSSKLTGPWVLMLPPVMVLLPIFVMVFSQTARAKLWISISYLVFVIAFIAVVDRRLDGLVQELGKSLNG